MSEVIVKSIKGNRGRVTQVVVRASDKKRLYVVRVIEPEESCGNIRQWVAKNCTVISGNPGDLAVTREVCDREDPRIGRICRPTCGKVARYRRMGAYPEIIAVTRTARGREMFEIRHPDGYVERVRADSCVLLPRTVESLADEWVLERFFPDLAEGRMAPSAPAPQPAATGASWYCEAPSVSLSPMMPEGDTTGNAPTSRPGLEDASLTVMRNRELRAENARLRDRLAQLLFVPGDDAEGTECPPPPVAATLTPVQLRELVEHLACIRTSFELWNPLDLTQLSGKEVSYAAALAASELLDRIAIRAGKGGGI